LMVSGGSEIHSVLRKLMFLWASVQLNLLLCLRASRIVIAKWTFILCHGSLVRLSVV
jgi:hypothetical protein